MSTRLGVRKPNRAESARTSARPVSAERPESRVTVLAIEQALAELGIRARLSDIVSKAQNSTKESSNRTRAVSRSKCAE